MIIVVFFSKSSFLFTLKHRAGVFKFLRFEELCFRDGLVWTVGLTGEIIKLSFHFLRRDVDGSLECMDSLPIFWRLRQYQFLNSCT